MVSTFILNSMNEKLDILYVILSYIDPTPTVVYAHRLLLINHVGTINCFLKQ